MNTVTDNPRRPRSGRGFRRLACVAALCAFILASLGMQVAQASGGPYVVDDADVVDAGSCALEAFHAWRGGEARVSSIAPVCRIAEVEWTLGLTRARIDAERADGVELSAKRLLRPVETGGVGVAIAAGVGRGLSGGSLAEGFVNLPVTWEPVEALRLHLNLGTAHAREDRSWVATGGVGFDWTLTDRLNLLGEHFRDSDGLSGWQLGLRPALVEDRVFLDLTWARDIDDIDGDWWTVGVVVAF